MKESEKQYIKDVIDHYISMYSLDLKPYNKAYRIWFDTGLHEEIIIDFLKRVRIPANIRLRRTSTKTVEKPNRTGYITPLNRENPVSFISEEFKKIRFEIGINHCRYASFEEFICTLIHELSHLLLFSTRNKYYKSEVATDLFVMAFGLYEEGVTISERMLDVPGYITKEQITFAYEYIQQKKIATQKKIPKHQNIIQKILALLDF